MVRRHLMQNIFTMEAVQECKRRHREAKRLPWDGAMISEHHLRKVGANKGHPQRSESHHFFLFDFLVLRSLTRQDCRPTFLTGQDCLRALHVLFSSRRNTG